MKPLRDCEDPDTTDALERLWNVLSDPDCSKQEDRKNILFETFFGVTDRIKLRDLKLVSNILDEVVKRAELQSKYKEHANKILCLLKSPIRMEKSSDQLKYKRYIVDFYTVLGYILIRTGNKSIQLDILEIVLRILTTKRIGDSDMVPVGVCVKALELSELAECLSLALMTTEKEVFGLVVLSTLQISQMSKLCCWTLLMHEAMESLLVRLSLECNDEVSDNMCHVLWELLNCTERQEDWQKVEQPSRMALRSLRHVLREQALTHTHPGKSSDVLCNIAALILKLIHLFPNADYIMSGLTEDITLSATLTESVLEIHIIPFFKTKEDHLHFKKLMLACLAASPVNHQCLEIYERYKLAECLVSMLRLDSTQSRLSWMTTSLISLTSDKSSQGSDTVWFIMSQEQSIDVFKCAVPVVSVLFTSLQERFIKAGLIDTLMSFLTSFYIQDKIEVDEILSMTIRLIFCICFTDKSPDIVRNSMIQGKSFTTLLDCCSLILKSRHPLTIRTQSILSYILQILSVLMEQQEELKRKSTAKTFQAVQHLYHRIIQPLPTDSVIDNRLIVLVANFAWVLMSKKRNLKKFFDSGEVYSHLDILERSELPVQLIYLSMLVDITEYPDAIPYLVSWRGRKGIKLLSILCRIWRQEEERLHVERDMNGCIADIERPLMGDEQFSLSKNDKRNYFSVCDVFGSCRPKIYAFMQLLHRHDHVVQICEDHYRLGYDVLPWEDQVTLQLVEAYLPLKLGEVWWEIFNKQEDVLPLDRYMAQTLADRYLNWSLCVQRAQEAVLQQRNTVYEREEHQYYIQVKSVRLTAALESLRQVVAIARSSDRNMLQDENLRLRECVEDSRPSVTADLDLHVAFPEDVRVLALYPEADVVLQREEVHHPVCADASGSEVND